MAALSWVRVDASLPSNPKILTLLSEKGGDHALCVCIFALGYCAQHGTDGFVPEIALGLIHGKAKDAALLISAGLWHQIPGGFDVNDWAEYQPSDEESKRRSEKAKRAAEVRWAKAQRPNLKAVN